MSESIISIQHIANSGKIVTTKEDSYIEINKVRISPAKIVFEDAFVGRKYCKEIVIQNYGNHMAYVTLFIPTSIAFHIKPVRQTPLPPGLKISSKVYYTHNAASDILVFYGGLIPIVINEHRIHYVLDVTLSATRVIAIPTVLDFGCLDVASSSVTRKLVLHNIGSKATHFAIDLPKENKELIIEPKKGFLKEQQKIELTVELISNAEGTFEQDVWVKTDQPFNFSVVWVAIKPSLISIHTNATADFTLIDFPRTYFGTSIFQSMIIHSKSNERLIYAIMALIDQRVTDINAAREISEDMRQFRINPVDGRMDPNEARILQFMFSPVKEEHEKRLHFDTFYLCILKVIPLHFKDLYTPVFKTSEAKPDKLIIPKCESKSTMSISDESFMLEEKLSSKTTATISDDNGASLTIYLHAEAETPNISVLPTELCLNELINNEETRRVLMITNNSTRLPMWLQYNKIPYVFINPVTFKVNASESLEILVQIKPAKMGPVHTKIVFDLLYQHRIEQNYQSVGVLEVPLNFFVQAVTKKPKPKFLMGITPNGANEVGFLTEDVRFNTNIDNPRAAMVQYKGHPKDDDLIAFPNDRSLTLKPWRTDVNCRTIFAGMQRNLKTFDSNYALNELEVAKKLNNNTYYEQFLQKEATKMKTIVQSNTNDYHLTYNRLMLIKEEKMDLEKVKLYKKIRQPEFISLAAKDLMLIKIKPSIIQLGQVAKQTKVQGLIFVTNKIQFPIRIFLVPTTNIEYINGNRLKLNAYGCCEIKFVYVGKSDGIFDTIIRVVINESHEFGVSVRGEVVPQSLFIDTKFIVFDQANELSKRIDIYNPFQTYTQFRWEITTSSCFRVTPYEGLVPPKSHLISDVRYYPEKDESKIADMNLISNYYFNHVVKLIGCDIPLKVSLDPEVIQFDNIPLHLTSKKKIYLRNDGNVTVRYEIQNPVPLDGIHIKPINGHILSNSITSLEITIELNMVIQFAFTIIIDFKCNREKSFELIGNVVYPELIIEPRLLSFRRIYEHAYDLLPFQIKNVSKAIIDIDFGIDNYKEISIFQKLENPKYIKGIKLVPNEQVDLYMEYIPLFVSTLSFLLPMVINKLLGPPEINFVQTQRSIYFMKPVAEQYLSNVAVVPIPDSFPVVKVYTFVRKQAITFTTFKMEFRYYQCLNYESITELSNTIYNPTTESVEFILRIDDVHEPFSIEYQDGQEVEVHEVSLSAVLPSKSQTTFVVRFNPTEHGTYDCKIPVYVRNYIEGNVYQYLTCSGTYYKPTMVSCVDIVYLEPIFFNTCSQYELTLSLNYHKPHCNLICNIDVPELKVQFDGGRNTRSSSCFVIKYATLTFVARVKMGIDTTICFQCSCDASCKVQVKSSAENCHCTNHAFLFTHFYGSCADIRNLSASNRSMESVLSFQSKQTLFQMITNKNENDFPYFPKVSDCSHYGTHMQNVLKIVESWMYTQGFYMKKYHIIPDDIRETIIHDYYGLTTPYFELFSNIAGKEIRKIIPKCPMERHQKVECLYWMYGHAKQMVVERGGLLPHVNEEHLFPYEDYVYFMTKFNHSDAKTMTIMSDDQFKLFSQQAWLDMLLQTYKVFVHNRPSFENEIEFEIADDYCINSRIIYNWLEELTRENATKLWLFSDYHKLNKFKVFDITESIVDSYALACATYHYCPYLKEYFTIFHMEDSYETQYYNAAKLVSAWKELNITFDVQPTNITQPNIVHLMMFLTYLYDFLPQLEVKETHSLYANIANKTKKSIVIENVESYTIKYTIKFFQDKYNCFSVDYDEIVIPSRKRSKINIIYYAKKMERQCAYMYICGESKGYHYAKSKVFNIIGIPHLEKYKSAHKIKLNMYRKENVNLEIESPYQTECTYQVYVAEDALKEDELNNYQFVDIKPSFYPKRVVMNDASLSCDVNGLGHLKFHAMAFSPFEKKLFVYCRNETVGDFCIKLITIVKPHDKHEILQVNIMENLILNPCICTKDNIKDDCPKMIKIMIPSRHKFLFDEFMNIFIAHLGNLSDDFWNKYARSNVCAHMIEKLKTPSLYVSDDITHIFNKDTIYNVKTKLRDVTMDKSILIKDVKSLETIPLRYHVNHDHYPNAFQLTLISQDKNDIRHYYVNFYLQIIKSSLSFKKCKKSSEKAASTKTSR